MSEGDRSDALLSVLAGVGLGALVGAAAALLLAPQSGQETRTQLRGTADELLVKLRDAVEEMRAKVDEMVASLKARTEGGAGGELRPPTPAGGDANETSPAGV